MVRESAETQIRARTYHIRNSAENIETAINGRQMDSANLGRQELVDSGSLLDSTVRLSSFGGVPEGNVWNQDFLMDGGSSEGMQNMQNNFAPNLNEVLCSRALRHDDHLLNQPCDQTAHLKKMEDDQMSGGWELRNQMSSFQTDQHTNIGKHHEQLMPPISNYSLQWLDDRLHTSCTLSDLGSWPIPPNAYNNHSGLDMPMPQFHHGSIKEECSPMAYPGAFLQGFGSSNPYKNSELGLPGMDILDQSHHTNKSVLKSINSNSCHHIGTIMNAADQEYNINAGGLMLNSSTGPAKPPSGLLTFGNSCMSMPMLDFLACKPDNMRLQHSPSALHYNLQDGKQKHSPATAHNRSAMSHGFDESANSETKRSSAEGTSEAVFKRPRLETSSALTTFKVRKEKLGDRITALQQLVSPFGKTDTASVLLEAIGYIKFLQDQVQALSLPYMKTGCGTSQGGQEDGNEPRQDLRSRGLCLVPLSCTLHVANDSSSDYWTPSIGGTYR